MRIANWGLAIAFVLAGTNCGWGATPVSVVPKGAVQKPRQPQVAIDPQGTVYVAFGAGEAIYCSTSTDQGKTYGNPVKVSEVPKLALGMRRGPRIATGPGFVVITAIGHESGNLLSWRSTDRGKSWQGPVQVNDSPRDAREGLHALAAGRDGQLYCVWLDCRDQSRGSRVFGAGSHDGGRSWTKNQEVYRSPSGSVCECCHPSVAMDPRGGLYVMWRNSLDGNRDLYLTLSDDGGKTFGKAAKLGTLSWRLDGCPMDGGSLAVVAPGKVTTIWRSEKQIYRTDSSGDEKLLGAGEQPWAAATRDGAWLAWISQRGGELFVQSPQASAPVRIADHAIDPVIAAPLGKKGPVIVAWETTSGIYAAVIGD